MRTGKQIIEHFSKSEREVWVAGERVKDPTQHPAFKNVIRSLADLYDMQHDPKLTEQMSFVSPSTGDRVGRSFQMPRSIDDLVMIRKMIKTWSDYSGGMMGRSPDYMNRALMAYASAPGFFDGHEKGLGENVRKYYEFMRENDLILTHTLIAPQANVLTTTTVGKADPTLAARIVSENDTGVVLRGARRMATLPVADEIAVFPTIQIKSGKDDLSYAFALAVSCSTPGVKFICREPFNSEGSRFDHPLSSRFDEMDAVVVFDDVFVPWERVFIYRDAERCNTVYQGTNAVVHMAHQTLTKNISKTEFVLGVASLVIDAIAIEQHQHVMSKMAEIIYHLETLKALLRASEADAKVNQWGVMTPHWGPLDAARNIFPNIYPRITEILQLLSLSSLVSRPTEADFQGPLKDLVDLYYQGIRVDSKERVRLFRLAWDMTISSFAGRQILYERCFFGDPVRMQMTTFAAYDRKECIERAKAILKETGAEANDAIPLKKAA